MSEWPVPQRSCGPPLSVEGEAAGGGDEWLPGEGLGECRLLHLLSLGFFHGPA